MKKNVFLGVLVIGSVIMSGQSVMGSLMPKLGSIFSWVSTEYDFGAIQQNEAVEHIFRFTNDGDQPLIISSVKASCGCTVADYTKSPIAPGETGEVSARYNSAKIGVFNKTVRVNANTSTEVVVLSLRGEVVASE